MFAILFGLSMDYEVFLLSRVREEYLDHGDTAARGHRRPGQDRARHHRGGGDHGRGLPGLRRRPTSLPRAARASGMATAILVDATVVRMVLVPGADAAVRAGELVDARRGWTGGCRGSPSADPRHQAGGRPPPGRQPRAGQDEQQAGDRARAEPLAEQRHAQRDGDDRVDVGDDRRPARADLGDQREEEQEGERAAREAEDQRPRRSCRRRASRWAPTRRRAPRGSAPRCPSRR